MTGNSLRQRAKHFIDGSLVRLAKRTPPGEVPKLSADEWRACSFFLRVYEATIDEYKAQNPIPVLTVGGATQEDLDRMFAKAQRPGLS